VASTAYVRSVSVTVCIPMAPTRQEATLNTSYPPRLPQICWFFPPQMNEIQITSLPAPQFAQRLSSRRRAAPLSVHTGGRPPSQTTEVSLSFRRSPHPHEPVTRVCQQRSPSDASPAQSVRQTPARWQDQTGRAKSSQAKEPPRTTTTNRSNDYAVEVSSGVRILQM